MQTFAKHQARRVPKHLQFGLHLYLPTFSKSTQELENLKVEPNWFENNQTQGDLYYAVDRARLPQNLNSHCWKQLEQDRQRWRVLQQFCVANHHCQGQPLVRMANLARSSPIVHWHPPHR